MNGNDLHKIRLFGAQAPLFKKAAVIENEKCQHLSIRLPGDQKQSEILMFSLMYVTVGEKLASPYQIVS